ncbi:ATP-grasp domain-containing protein [Rhizobiales bacterium]|uniref:ATP-grasp domain-containing protein n=1 Tax=Hongsoonwoonella zoysiae TaxID=2821844 RepID=UPI00155F5F55|nr:ATP-grasp domain-containing protein [Hongsoonwoonella zoysiae]NRG18311.1 ATP-grasp domain-containing protein [Hongsoonwoonella zoysiae]
MAVTVLISSAGRRVGLLECFRASARDANIDLKVLACDMDPELSPACRLADKAFSVPRCDDPSFAERMLEISTLCDVDLIVPTIDPELSVYSANIQRFAECGTHVHVSPPAVIGVVRDKGLTAEKLKAAGVPVPDTYTLEFGRENAEKLEWPLFLKPSGGSASRGIRAVSGPEGLPERPEEPMILQQLLEGPEFTVNIFIDKSGKLRCAIPHRRLRVRAGEVEKGITERAPVFRELALGVLRALPEARGVLCFQVIKDKTAGPCVFEINARFGGGYPLAHHAGAHFTRWLLEEISGQPSSASDDWRSGALMLRYDAAVFEG